MRKITRFALVFLLLLGGLAPQLGYSMASRVRFEQFKEITKKAGFAYLQCQAIDLTCIVAHELGHAITAKYLCGWPLEQFAITHDFKPFWAKGWVNAYVPEGGEFGIKSAIMLALGPVGGIVTAAAIHKANAIYGQYKKSKNFHSACIEGLKKPWFNKDQPVSLQVITAIEILKHFSNLLPINSKMDGSKLLDALGIWNPCKHFPKAQYEIATNIMAGAFGGVLGTIIFLKFMKPTIEKWKAQRAIETAKKEEEKSKSAPVDSEPAITGTQIEEQSHE